MCPSCYCYGICESSNLCQQPHRFSHYDLPRTACCRWPQLVDLRQVSNILRRLCQDIFQVVDFNLPVTKESTKEFDRFVVRVRTNLKRKSKCKCALEIAGVVAQKGLCGGMWRLWYTLVHYNCKWRISSLAQAR